LCISYVRYVSSCAGCVFFFQAEDGIRDWSVTGVQTCALPILYAHLHEVREGLKVGRLVKAGEVIGVMGRTANTHEGIAKDRAHEIGRRRVGKEGRCRGGGDEEKKKKGRERGVYGEKWVEGRRV